MPHRTRTRTVAEQARAYVDRHNRGPGGMKLNVDIHAFAGATRVIVSTATIGRTEVIISDTDALMLGDLTGTFDEMAAGAKNTLRYSLGVEQLLRDARREAWNEGAAAAVDVRIAGAGYAVVVKDPRPVNPYEYREDDDEGGDE